MIVPFSEKNCALCLHVGRANIRIGPSTYEECMEMMKVLSTKQSQREMLEDVQRQMDDWTDEYDRETLESIEAEEFWFKIEQNYEDPLLPESDRRLTPHQRWMVYKTYLNDDHLLMFGNRRRST